MASNYPQIYVKDEDDAGVITSVGAGVTVKARAAGSGSDAAESPFTTDSDGKIASGSFASISVGTRVHFRVENLSGKSASVTIITT